MTFVDMLVLKEVLKFFLGLFESHTKLILVDCHIVMQSLFDFSDFLRFGPNFIHFFDVPSIFSNLFFGGASNFAEISSSRLIILNVFSVLPTAQVLDVCIMVPLLVFTLHLFESPLLLVECISYILLVLHLLRLDLGLGWIGNWRVALISLDVRLVEVLFSSALNVSLSCDYLIDH